MPGLHHVLGSRALLVWGLLGNQNLELQVERTQQGQQMPRAVPWRENQSLSSLCKGRLPMAVPWCSVSLCRAGVGCAHPRSQPSGELLVIHQAESEFLTLS